MIQTLTLEVGNMIDANVPDLTPTDGEPKPKKFLISDTHFSHASIIKYQNRPFKSVQEMDYEIVRRWNEAVSPTDIVYFLGDLAFKHSSQWLAKLNGRIVYLNGNHSDKGFADYLVTHYEGRPYMMVHDPINAPGEYSGWLIHGHCHANCIDKYPLINPKMKTVNVCVELIGYTPIEFSKVHELVKQNKRVERL
jgi:calcineurin-like phosphoesterase family protein